MRALLFVVMILLPLTCSNSVEPYSLQIAGSEEVAKLPEKTKPTPRLFDGVTGCFARDDMETVKDWVLGEGDANSQYSNGTTLLTLSIYHQRPEMAAWLIEQGADVDYQSGKWTYSPLQYAISKGRTDMLPVLIAGGANLDLRNPKKSTALHTAALQQDAAAIEMLLSAGANPLMYDQYGYTPLHRVSAKFRSYERHELTGDFLQAARLLMDAGVVINAVSIGGRTALYDAVDNMAPEIIQLLLEAGADPNIVPPEKPSALQVAVTKDSLELVKALVEAGADIDAVDKYGATAITKAASKKQFGIVDYLVGAGADPSICNEGAFSALHWVAGSKKSELCRKLIEAGAVADLASNNGSTPMAFAAAMMFDTTEQETYDTLALLLEYDRNLNVASSKGMYPIHYSAAAGYISCVKLLLEHEARLDVRSDSGLLPMHIAARNRHREMIPLLTNESIQPDIYVAYRLYDMGLFNALVADGADLNQPFDDGHSVLTLAAWNKKSEWVELLLALGADVNFAGNDGTTALMKSCNARREDIAKTLLEYGADPAHVANGNISVLHQAANWEMAGIVAMLLDAGARPNVTTSRGDTPLHWAAKQNDVDSVEEMLIAGADINVQNDNGETPFFLACKDWNSDLLAASLLLRWSADPCIRDDDGELPRKNHMLPRVVDKRPTPWNTTSYSPSWFDWYTKINPEYKLPIEVPKPIHTKTPEERAEQVKEAIGCCE